MGCIFELVLSFSGMIGYLDYGQERVCVGKQWGRVLGLVVLYVEILVVFYVMFRNQVGFNCGFESYSCLFMQMGSFYCFVGEKSISNFWLFDLFGFLVQDGEG